MPTTSKITRRLLVNFIPQEWINGKAVPVGISEEMDATDNLLQMRLEDIHNLCDGHTCNALVDNVTWAHYGPYAVQAVESVMAYFGVNTLRDITEEILIATRSGTLSGVRTSSSTSLRSWMLTYGNHALLFACEAEHIGHAIELCGNANPGERIIGAFEVPPACFGQSVAAAQVEHVNNMVGQQTDAALAALQ